MHQQGADALAGIVTGAGRVGEIGAALGQRGRDRCPPAAETAAARVGVSQ